MRLRVALGCAMFLAAAAHGVAEDAFEPNPSLARLSADDAYARRTARSLRDAGIDMASAIRLDESGRVLIVGTTDRVPWGPPRVARLDADGRLDTTFGDGGVVELPVRAWNDLGLEIDAAGRIVVSGPLYEAGTNPYESVAPDFAAARLLADGSLDPALSADGLLDFLPASGIRPVGAVRLTGGDGAMLVVAEKAGADSDTLVGLVRIAADGTIDPAYGDGGFAVVAQWFHPYDPASVTDFAVDSAGRAAVVVTDPSTVRRPTLRRLDAAGVLDPPLSSSYGWWGQPTFTATRIELDGQDRIVGLGAGSIFRRLPDGAPDASFSGDGYAWRVDVAGFAGGVPTWQYVQERAAYDPYFDPASEAPLLAVATHADRWVLAKPDPYYEVKGRRVGGIRIQAIDPADSGAIITVNCVSPTRSHSGVSGLIVTPDGTTAYALGHTTSSSAGHPSRGERTVPFVTRVDLITRKALPLPDLRVKWLGWPHAIDFGGRYRVTARVRIRNASRHTADMVCGYVRFGESPGGDVSDGDDATPLPGLGTRWAGGAHWRPFHVRARSSVVKRFTWEGTYDGPGSIAGARLSVRFSGSLPDGNPADNTATSPPISPLYASPR